MRLFLSRLLLFIFSLLSVWVIYQTQPSIWESLRLRIEDMRYEAVDLKPSNQVIFIDIDGASVDRYGRWPWNRADLAMGLKKLAPAKVVVLDMVFSEPTEEEQDMQLAETLMDMGNVVGGFFFTDEKTELDVDAEDSFLLNGILSHIPSHAFEAYSGAGIEHSIIDILYAYAWNASFSIMPDIDGNLRRYSVFFQYGDMIYPSLGTAALRLYWNREIGYQKGRVLSFGDLSFRTDKKGQLLLHIYNPKDFIRYSFVDLADGKIDASKLRDKIAIVGISEAGVSDIVNTPLGRIPGPLVHASFLSNLIEHHIPQFQPLTCLIGTCIAALIPLVFIYLIRRSWVRFLSYIVCVAVVTYGVEYYYQASQILVGHAYWGLSFVIAAFVQEGCRLLLQDYRIRLAKSSLSQSTVPMLKEQLKDLEKKMDQVQRLTEVHIFSIANNFIEDGFDLSSWKCSFSEMARVVGESAVRHEGLILDSGSRGFRIIFGLSGHKGDPTSLALSFAQELQELWQPQYDGETLDKNAAQIQPIFSIYTGEGYLSIISTPSGRRLDVLGPLIQAHQDLKRYLPVSMISRIFIGVDERKNETLDIPVRPLIRGNKPFRLYELRPLGEAHEVIFEHYNKACDFLKEGRLEEAKKSLSECYEYYWDPLSLELLKEIEQNRVSIP